MEPVEVTTNGEIGLTPGNRIENSTGAKRVRRSPGGKGRSTNTKVGHP